MRGPIRIAAIAPPTQRADDEFKNVRQALEFVREASAKGARLIMFPEGYPGPTTGPMNIGPGGSPLDQIREAAARHRVFIAAGCLEVAEVPGAFYLSHELISPDGRSLIKYRRCQPTPPATNAHLYNGRRHLIPGSPPTPATTPLGTIGIVICSELKVPELSRLLMLRGTELLLNPVGGAESSRTTRLWDGSQVPVARAKMDIWSAVAQARATENMMYVAVTANASGHDSRWGSCVTGPEGIIGRSEGVGVLYADVDMDRLHELRARAWRDEDYAQTTSSQYLTDPGQHRDRRPELYSEICADQADAFDFHYARRGVVAWREFDTPGRQHPPP